MHYERDFIKFMKANYAEIGKSISEKKVIDKETEAALKEAVKEFNDTFAAYDKTGAQAG